MENKISKPTKWHETPVLYFHTDRYGTQIEAKTIDNKIICQTLRHGWIYEYVIGDLRQEDWDAPLPYNIQREFGTRLSIGG